MQANKHQSYALRLINNVIFIANRQGKVFNNCCKNLIKIKKIRQNYEHIYLCDYNYFDIENTFYTTQFPTSLTILLDRT